MSLSAYAQSLTGISTEEISALLKQAIAPYMPAKKVLIIPPDITRANSYAGPIAQELFRLLGKDCHIDMLVALGTHVPMDEQEMDAMYAGIPHESFIAHDWRNDIVKLGQVPASFVKKVSEGLMDQPVDIEVNRLVMDKSYDLVLSIGQVVPHEVVGMANYSKNIFVGLGGSSMINATHFLGALYGMERMMGRDKTPVRQVLDYAQGFLQDIPLVYILTVTTQSSSGVVLNGLFADSGRQGFENAVKLSQQKNLTLLEQPLKKVICYLDPQEFKTTWLGNKAIYRTRMAISDGGELIIIAPGVQGFGEDKTNDALIRKYGYFGRDKVLGWANDPSGDLPANLSVAAHLIHGSSDGRFSITYAPGGLSRQEVEKAGFHYMPLQDALAKYDPAKLKDGFNTYNQEELFYVSNPALGLWAYKQRFYSV